MRDSTVRTSIIATHGLAGATVSFSGGATLDWREGLTAGIAGLSQRELDVFHALGEGESNRAIATRLAIKERTVKAHVARILAKLKVESRLQAGIIAFAWALSVGGGKGPRPRFCFAQDPDPYVLGGRSVHAEHPQDGGDRGRRQDDRQER